MTINRKRTLFVAMFPVTFTLLGTWQFCRHLEKKQKYEKLTAASDDIKVITHAPQLDQVMEGEMVIVQGSFVLSSPSAPKTVLVGPRLPPSEKIAPELGYQLYKKFQLVKDSFPLVLNMGWVSRNHLTCSSTTGECCLDIAVDDGIVRNLLCIASQKDEKVGLGFTLLQTRSSWWGPKHQKNPGSNIFFYFVKQDVEKQLGMDACSRLFFKVVDGLEAFEPRLVPNAPEPAKIVPHFQYMITWYVRLF